MVRDRDVSENLARIESNLRHETDRGALERMQGYLSDVAGDFENYDDGTRNEAASLLADVEDRLSCFEEDEDLER